MAPWQKRVEPDPWDHKREWWSVLLLKDRLLQYSPVRIAVIVRRLALWQSTFAPATRACPRVGRFYVHRGPTIAWNRDRMGICLYKADPHSNRGHDRSSVPSDRDQWSLSCTRQPIPSSYPAGIFVCFKPLPEQIPYDYGVEWNIMPALPIKLAEDPELRKRSWRC